MAGQPVSNLLNIFEKTKFDLEKSTDTVPGGPINETQYGHTQQWGPDNQYKLSAEGQIRSDNYEMQNSYNKTDFDLSNTSPEGGPINDPNSGFVHNYTPSSNGGYVDNPEGQERSGDSILKSKIESGEGESNESNLDVNDGEVQTDINNSRFNQPFTPENPYYTDNVGDMVNETGPWSVLKDSFKATALDLQDKAADFGQKVWLSGEGIQYQSEAPNGGGPNRINPNMPNGTYINTVAGGRGTSGGGRTLNTMTLHQYTPFNPYHTVGEAPEDTSNLPSPQDVQETAEQGNISGQIPPSVNPSDYETQPSITDITGPNF